jgi:endoglucanase
VKVRVVIVLLCLLVLVAVGIGVRLSDAGHDATSSAGASFLDRYVEPDGRVVRRDEGADTVSEGQAYALLLTVARGEQQRFATVWEWTRENLQRDDGLFSWRWADGDVADREAAADADVDIAHALALAIDRFGMHDLQSELDRISKSILDDETVRVNDNLVLVAGPWARGDRIINPSYFSPCAYDVLAHATGDQRWNQLSSSSGELLDQLITHDRLPPDWAVVDDEGAAHAIAAPGSDANAPQYGLDAARIALRLASCDSSARELLQRLWPMLKRLPDRGAAVSYDLTGHTAQDATHPLGLLAGSVTARVIGEAALSRSLLDEARSLNQRGPTYYGDAWLALHDTAFAPRVMQPAVALISSTGRVRAEPPTTGQESTAPSATLAAPTTTSTTAAPTTTPATTPATTATTTATTPSSSAPAAPGSTAPATPSSGTSGSTPSPPTGRPATPAPAAPGAPGAPPPDASAPAQDEPGSTTTPPSSTSPSAPTQPGTSVAPGTNPAPPGGLSDTVDVGRLLDTAGRPERHAAETRRRHSAAVFTTGLFVAAAAGVGLGLRQRTLRRRSGETK